MAIREENHPTLKEHETARCYYDQVYYREAGRTVGIPSHLGRLARKLAPWQGRRLLDIGCGTGLWLAAAAERGAKPSGIDISARALEICRGLLPEAELQCGPAEHLPFGDRQFDCVSCLGSLEHFSDPQGALREMIRVAKADAVFLLLVPNAGFLPRRLGLYSGTEQNILREEIHTLLGWQALFESVGLRVVTRWKDLHVLSRSWIFRGPWYSWPVRASQALALPLWPLTWQYQVYHLCVLR